MREFRTDQQNAPSREARNRRLIGWTIGGATAAVVAVSAVTATFVVSAPDTASVTAAGAPVVTIKDGGSAVSLLLRAAWSAERQPTEKVRDNQWVYVKSVYSTLISGVGRKVAVNRELWSAVDGVQSSMIRENGKSELVEWAVPIGGKKPTDPHPNNYRWIHSLPTDPDALLKKSYAEIPKEFTQGLTGKAAAELRDKTVFDNLSEIVSESIVPAKTLAAIYRAVAKIPGVTVTDNATDAVGRHGVGVAIVHGTERSSWIFDKKTYTYLGSSVVLVKKTKDGPAGRSMWANAVMKRAIVDDRGAIPGVRK